MRSNGAGVDVESGKQFYTSSIKERVDQAPVREGCAELINRLYAKPGD